MGYLYFDLIFIRCCCIIVIIRVDVYLKIIIVFLLNSLNFTVQIKTNELSYYVLKVIIISLN